MIRSHILERTSDGLLVSEGAFVRPNLVHQVQRTWPYQGYSCKRESGFGLWRSVFM